jgi:hypothetical protein
MSVEEKLVGETVRRTSLEPIRRGFKDETNIDSNKAAREELLRNYVPVVMEHIAKHGCSGLKCKRCPLNNVCDRNASRSKELANQMIAYANTQRVKKGV